ncbi:MAG: hypothetical protein ACP5IO_06015 [Elusimicrobiales bacterium]
MKSSKLFFIILFLFVGFNLFSDEIWLNDGSIIKGIIIEKSSDTFLVRGDNWWKRIKLDDIYKIVDNRNETNQSEVDKVVISKIVDDKIKNLSVNKKDTELLGKINKNISQIKEAGGKLKNVELYWWLGIGAIVVGAISRDEGSIFMGVAASFIFSFLIHSDISEAGEKMKSLELLDLPISKNVDTNLLLSKRDDLAVYGNLKYRF